MKQVESCRWFKVDPLIVALVLVVASFASGRASAQITAAALSGTVKDQTGGVLPGVDVSVTNEETSISRSTVSGSDGNYTLPGLPPGSYEVRAMLQGFRTDVRKGVVLTVGQQASVSFTLQVGTTSETVEVLGGAPIVDLKSAALSGFVSQKTIEDLPLNGRNYVSLATLQPGVSIFLDRPANNNTGGIELHINGAPGRSNSYLLDGANMKGAYGVGLLNAADTSLGVETVREFRVVTNSYSADYGRSMGGVINVVTKSGTNAVHGSGFEFHRNSAMDARNFFDPLSGPAPFNRNQYGFSLGGPVVKDRTFFFVGGEWLRDRLSVNQVLNVPNNTARAGALGPINPAILPYLNLYPTANGPDLGGGTARYTYIAQQPTDEHFLQARLDHNLSVKDQLFARYTDDRAVAINPVTFEQFNSRRDSTANVLTVEERRTISSTLLNTARVSYSRLLFLHSNVNAGVPASLFFIPDWNAPHDASNDFGNITVGGLSGLGATSSDPAVLNTSYITFSDDVNMSRGRQSLRFGVLVENARNELQASTNVRGSYAFPNLTAFLAGRASAFNGVFPGSFIQRSRNSMLYGFYAQDDITYGRLTLNLGLRYEFYGVPTDTQGHDSALRNYITDAQFTVGPIFQNPSHKNFGPRLGFAWDVTGDGRMSVRAGSGVYYDTDNTFNSPQIIGIFSPPFAQLVAIPNPPTFPVANFTASPVAPRLLDYNIQQPKLWSYNLNVQRQIGQGLAIMVGYAGSRGYDLVRAVEGNPNVPTIQADGSEFFPATGLVRRNPAWGAMDLRTGGGRSWYNSLQTMIQKRFTQGPQFQVSYTLAKTEDITQGQLGADVTNSTVFPQDPYNASADKAPSDFDVRHTFTFNFTWPLPLTRSTTGVAGAILGGWQVNGVGNFHSGAAFSPVIVANWSRSGSNRGSDRPNVAPGCDLDNIYLGNVSKYFDPTCFVLPPAGTFGNAGRNSLRGPKYSTFDVSLVRNISVGAQSTARSLQLRAEVFNLLNHANFAVPSGQIFAGVSQNEAPLASAGQITRTVGAARQVQLGVKFTF